MPRLQIRSASQNLRYQRRLGQTKDSECWRNALEPQLQAFQSVQAVAPSYRFQILGFQNLFSDFDRYFVRVQKDTRNF